MGFLLDIVYLTGLIAISPFWIYRMIRHGRYRDDISQRFGAVPIREGDKPAVWIHGVSLGEVNAARTLVAELHRQLPGYEVVISSTTETGMAAAKRLFAGEHLVFRWPFDFSQAVRKAILRIRPAIVVLMEGEVWPNFCAACNGQNVPVVVVNARMSANKGYPGYKKLGPLAAKLFNSVTAFGVQDESYAQRYRALGVEESKLRLTGMLKFDSAEVADRLDGQDELAAAMGITDEQKLIVCGGTGPGEEKILLDVFRAIGQNHAEVRCAIVPRKPERFNEVARLITDGGFELVRRSERIDCYTRSTGANDSQAIILGDTMGELRKFYAMAACVFVGRSLVDMGGSDMIEAAALGKATAFGPYTFNFPQADALAENGCVRVPDAEALKKQLDEWLTDSQTAIAAGKKAQDYVRNQQGATQKNVEMIREILEIGN